MKQESEKQRSDKLFDLLIDLSTRTPFLIQDVRYAAENIDLISLSIARQHLLYHTQVVEDIKLKINSNFVIKMYWNIKLKKAIKYLDSYKRIYEEELKVCNYKNKNGNQ